MIRTTTIAGVLLALSMATPRASAQTPEQRYTDWATPAFPAEEYERRRAAMMLSLQDAGGGVLLVPSSDGATDGGTFRQIDDFLYFTGLELPGSLLVLDADEDAAILFLPDRDPRFENPGRPNDFPGRPLGADPEVAALAGIERTAGLEGLPYALASWAAGGRRVLVDLGEPGPVPETTLPYVGRLGPTQTLLGRLQRDFPALTIGNAFVHVARLRMRKSELEVEALRRAATATATAIASAARGIIPGVDERTLQGFFEAACRREGSERIPFTPIVKSGPNSLWPWRILAAHAERRNRTLAEGDVVIFDVGCEVGGYVSDVGRTFPAAGTFSDLQRAKLTMVTAVADAIIAGIRPGRTLADLTRVAYAAIPAEEARYMQTPSFFGHHIGLSTGDPSLLNEPLAPGMVFTVEPWYYNHDEGISVFVEDVVLVTEDGAEVLTAMLPRSPEALEEMVR